MVQFINIAARLRVTARDYPELRGVVVSRGRDAAGRRVYEQWSFQRLDQESDRLARGLQTWGVQPGARLVLMVRPGLEFIALTFAMFKAGVTIVLIDPGMGKSHLLKCLEEAQPQGFVAIRPVHVVRWWYRQRFPLAQWNVSVGGWMPNCGRTYSSLLGEPWQPFEITRTRATDSAAVIFTSGSTGPPKGVVYEHGMFDAQVDLLRDFYSIQPGEADLPGFPLFALFNAAMAVTTVVPDMDPTRPANVNPKLIIEAIRDQQVTQAFGSPALWNRMGRYCVEHQIQLPTIRRGLSAGGPVPQHVLERMTQVFTGPGGDLHTPYGATESLPVASIGAKEALANTIPQTRLGAGTCVGRAFPQIEIRIIAVTDGPIHDWSQVRELPVGQIGEIVVRGPSVTREYFRRPEATAAAKIADGDTFWHRIGDVGYQDAAGLLWFCGRKAHTVSALAGPMYSVCCEAIFENHPQVYRAALVGLGAIGQQRPVLIVEPEPDAFPQSPTAEARFRSELLQLGQQHALTRSINSILFHRSLPVDTRHNVKIQREALAEWAKGRSEEDRGSSGT